MGFIASVIRVQKCRKRIVKETTKTDVVKFGTFVFNLQLSSSNSSLTINCQIPAYQEYWKKFSPLPAIVLAFFIDLDYFIKFLYDKKRKINRLWFGDPHDFTIHLAPLLIYSGREIIILKLFLSSQHTAVHTKYNCSKGRIH